MIYAADTETYLVTPGLLAPKPVCLSWANEKGSGIIVGGEMVEKFRKRLEADTLIFHTGAYDLAVMCAADNSLLKPVFKALKEGRIHDVALREQLLELADGRFKFFTNDAGDTLLMGYGLADIAAKRLNTKLDKGEDTWRLRYAELDGLPLGLWPKAAKQYAISDSEVTLKIFNAQNAGGLVVNEKEQVQAAFALHLCGVWGWRTDAARIDAVEKDLIAKRDAILAQLEGTGIFRRDGSRNNKVLQQRIDDAYQKIGIETPRAEKGGVSYSEDVLRSSQDEKLMILADGSTVFKLLDSFIPVLKFGTTAPLLSGYNTLVKSGRCSARSPYREKAGKVRHGFNCQQLPRKGGIRECFVPREGFVYSSVDWSVSQLRCLAQICLDFFGHSALADALRAGKDPHLVFASLLLDKPYEWCVENKTLPEVKDARQFGKIVNFGVPGGLSPETLVNYARTEYGVEMSLDKAKWLHAKFFEAWPEIREFLSYVKRLVGRGLAQIEHSYSKRVAGGLGYTECANAFFQGLESEYAKATVFRIQEECYTVEDSPLYGCRMVGFIHDETILEVPEWKAHEAAMRQKEIHEEEQQKVLKDIPAKADPALMRRWYKGAEAVYESNRLVPWEPAHD